MGPFATAHPTHTPFVFLGVVWTLFECVFPNFRCSNSQKIIFEIRQLVPLISCRCFPWVTVCGLTQCRLNARSVALVPFLDQTKTTRATGKLFNGFSVGIFPLHFWRKWTRLYGYYRPFNEGIDSFSPWTTRRVHQMVWKTSRTSLVPRQVRVGSFRCTLLHLILSPVLFGCSECQEFLWTNFQGSNLPILHTDQGNTVSFWPPERTRVANHMNRYSTCESARKLPYVSGFKFYGQQWPWFSMNNQLS